MNFRPLLYFVICLSCVFTVAHFIDRGKIMTPEITVPYFSGAALINQSDRWIFNVNEVDSLKKINAVADTKLRIQLLDHYKFSRLPSTTHTYELNQPGLVYLISASQFLFPLYGEIGSLKLFQLCIHLLFSYLILISLRNPKKQIAFFFLYIINPFIIYLTLFPFYYFWQVINAFVAILLLKNTRLHKPAILLLTALLFAGLYHVRVSTLPLSIFVLVFCFYKLSVFLRSTAVVFMIAVIMLLNPSYLSKHPGHVMYSSLGAYGQSPVRGFSDNISFEDYNKATGNNFTYESTPSLYDSTVIMGEARWGAKQFISFAKSQPLIILRNACLNFFESFSLGYSTASMAITYLSAALGFLFFCLLAYRRHYQFIFLIMGSTVSYIFYLAPVPIYLFGTYVLLAFAAIETFIIDKK
jgi:hypothetical protein